jgi:hypothetical protein
MAAPPSAHCSRGCRNRQYSRAQSTRHTNTFFNRASAAITMLLKAC